MALIDTEGFGLSTSIADFYTYKVFSGAISSSGTGGGSAIFSTGGPSNDPYIDISSATINSSVGRYLPGNYSTFFSGQSYSIIDPNSTTYPNSYISFLDKASRTPQVTIALSSATNVISVYRGATGGTLLGSSAAGVYPLTGAWFSLEAAITISPTVGSCEVKVNGTDVITLSGVNTQNVASGTVGAVQWGAGVQKGVSAFYFCDNTGGAPWNTFLGAVRVATVRPTTNDAVTFTPVGNASNYLNAAEYPPVPGTDYNQSGTVGAQDTFSQGGLPAGTWTVLGITTKELFRLSSFGSRQASGLVKSGVSVALGATRTIVGTANVVVTDVFETDPATSAQWTSAAAGAVKNGYRIIA